MEKSILAKIRFQHYIVKDIKFHINEEFNDDAVELKMDFDNEIGIRDNEAIVTLKCYLFKDCNKTESPFNLEVEIVGFFSYESNLKEDDLNSYLNTNTVAILFPYLRSIVSTITVNSGIPALILPTVNVVKMLENQ